MGIWKKPGGAKEWPKKNESPRELFTLEVEAILSEMPEVTSFKRRADEFVLDVMSKGIEHAVFLENTFHESREMSPEARTERIRRVVSAIGSDSSTVEWEDVRERIVPLVRASTLFLAMIEDSDKMPLSRPVMPFVIQALAIDSPTSLQYVVPSNADDWGVDFETLFEVARLNAARYFGSADAFEIYDAQAPYPLWHVSVDDDYEPSRLLLPGWLAAFQGKVVGRPVAIMPERATLVVGGDGDERCLKRLIEMADREFAASRRSISPALYTVDENGEVVPLVLPHGHPLANDVALGHMKLALGEYQTQKEVLQARLGEDIFVASYLGVQRPDGSVLSYATWTEGVASLLPKVDEVALLSGDMNDPTVHRIAWSVLTEIAGAYLVRDPDLHPARFRAMEWPDPPTLGRLRSAALE
jgi:hypothetical protein